MLEISNLPELHKLCNNVINITNNEIINTNIISESKKYCSLFLQNSISFNAFTEAILFLKNNTNIDFNIIPNELIKLFKFVGNLQLNNAKISPSKNNEFLIASVDAPPIITNQKIDLMTEVNNLKLLLDKQIKFTKDYEKLIEHQKEILNFSINKISEQTNIAFTTINNTSSNITTNIQNVVNESLNKVEKLTKTQNNILEKLNKKLFSRFTMIFFIIFFISTTLSVSLNIFLYYKIINHLPSLIVNKISKTYNIQNE